MELEQKWSNPISDINYQNYEEGLIKNYQLGFQEEEWYKKNKDNFCNSLKNYPDLLPNFVKETDPNLLPNNYLGFYPDEFIRYGYLEKIKMVIENNVAFFWVVRLPKGLQLYHSSRSLGLNHSDFPIPGYSNQLSAEKNKTNSKTNCTVNNFIKNNPCTNISYYSSPYVTEEYIKKVKYMGKQINYAYGISDPQTKSIYNDRLVLQSNEYGYGVAAYKLKSDSYFMILGLDDYLIDRPDLGRENMRTFKRAMTYLSYIIKKDTEISEMEFQNFLNIIDSVSGIGSIQDNINLVTNDYNQPNFKNVVTEWIYRNANSYFKNPLNTAGYIKNTSNAINNGITNLELYKGLRFSTYEHDRIVMNMVKWLFSNYLTDIKIEGFVSSALFVPTKNKSIIKEDPFIRKELSYYIPQGMFHSEIGMFFAPDSLERNKNDKYDLDYSINYEGITQELRKYKTNNITRYGEQGVEGFHQGHLLEHSSWVGLISENLASNLINFQNKDVALIAGYFHDIGKSGECVQTSVYKGLDFHDPKVSVCTFVNDNNEIVGMDYFDIPDHPEKGYEFLKGYRTYKKYTLTGIDSPENYNKNAIPVYMEDWEKMFDHLKIDLTDRKLIRIAAGAHWYYGDYINKFLITGDIQQSVNEFLRKIEIFYNDEFIKPSINTFLMVIKFVLLISVADIIGSEYNLNLESSSLINDQKATVINFLPNLNLKDYFRSNNPKPVIDQLVDYAMNLQKNDSNKNTIIINIQANFDKFLNYITNSINSFDFKLNNNYSLLYNLINSYVGIDDIKRAYPRYFPSVIVFDLDQTLFNVQFNDNSLSSYQIYSDTYKVIEEVQKVRNFNNKTYVAIVSRHYSPRSLISLLSSKIYDGKDNPLYYKNFDFIVSRYTGSEKELQQVMSNVQGFFSYNGLPDEGFVMDVETDSYNRIFNNDPNFLNINQPTKSDHFKLVKNKFNVNYNQILAFDDDKRYFSSIGLGEAEDVTVAGVLSSRNINEQGIRTSLFKTGVAYYVFSQLVNQN